MKRFTALLLAVAMVFGFSACGGTQDRPDIPDEAVALLDYTVPEHTVSYLPDDIVTEEEMRSAWQFAINRMFDGGVQYNGIPVASMTKGYARQQLAEDGYEVTDYNKNKIEAKKDDHKVSVTQDDEGRVEYFDVQFFGMDKDDFNREELETAKKRITIGQNLDLLGNTFDEMFSQLGVSQLMAAFVKAAGGSYHWYDDNNSYFGIILEAEQEPDGRYDLSLSLSRRENGHYQSVNIFNTDLLVSTVYYGESFYGQDAADNIARHADIWRTENLLMSKIWYDEGRGIIMFDINDRGQALIPYVGSKLADIKWENLHLETTDTGRVYVCSFRVQAEDGNWVLLTMNFDKTTETITLYTADKQVAGVFTH